MRGVLTPRTRAESNIAECIDASLPPPFFYSTTLYSEPVERSNFDVHVKTGSLALERSIEQQGRVIDERRWGTGSFLFAGQTAVDHPAAFRWHASSKKNRPS